MRYHCDVRPGLSGLPEQMSVDKKKHLRNIECAKVRLEAYKSNHNYHTTSSSRHRCKQPLSE